MPSAQSHQLTGNNPGVHSTGSASKGLGHTDAVDLQLHSSLGLTGKPTDKLAAMKQAKLKGYEGDACSDCGSFTMVRNGTCLKCLTCGTTSGCS